MGVVEGVGTPAQRREPAALALEAGGKLAGLVLKAAQPGPGPSGTVGSGLLLGEEFPFRGQQPFDPLKNVLEIPARGARLGETGFGAAGRVPCLGGISGTAQGGEPGGFKRCRVAPGADLPEAGFSFG